MESIILASASPRRRELLEAAGIPFVLCPTTVDEALRENLVPAERVVSLAIDKARAGAALASDSSPRLVLGADTLVCVQDTDRSGAEIALGKPVDEEEAQGMIRILSGRTHIVRTGLALLDRSSGQLRVSRSDSIVSFARMSEVEIRLYIAGGEWRGVAGAYRIQGMAAFFIDKLEGSWSGVVGLPLRELYGMLKEADFRIPTMVA
jgi:septum formation protein